MSNALANLIPRLDGVRERSDGQFTARCPAHEDRSPSLSVTEGRNGQVLVHCFAGCSVDDICGAVGLEVSDLFPDGGRDRARDPRRGPAVNWRAIVRELCLEISVLEVAAAAADLSDTDRARVDEARDRIDTIRRTVDRAR